MAQPHSSVPIVDILEHGAARDGTQQVLDRRLFMLLQAFDADRTTDQDALCAEWRAQLEAAAIPAVLYAEVARPGGFALLTWAEDPAHFIDGLRPALADLARRFEVTARSGQCTLGRTYSTGFEQDLEHWLLRRPIATVTHPERPWAVWYPLRRSGSFERLEPRERASVMREHAGIGRAYGDVDLAHDVRLACHGLDADDNDFLIGLIGHELFPLSHVVQAMRASRQTSEYIVKMGPFFVGRRRWATTAADPSIDPRFTGS